jgi:tetratricopeptide (TPR) repeat protein
VTLNIVRPDDSIAWAKQYEGSIDDVFALHRTAAESLGEALQVSLSGPERERLARAPTGDGEAFALYGRARALLERVDVAGNVPRAIQLLQEALQRDSRFALAHAALGEAHWRRYEETRDPAEAARAQDSITEALRLDPDQPLTRLALAEIYRGTSRAPQAAEELQRLLARDPARDDARRLLGEILLAQGRAPEALIEMRGAVAQRPDSGATRPRWARPISAPAGMRRPRPRSNAPPNCSRTTRGRSSCSGPPTA